jgi:hypothetical protein
MTLAQFVTLSFRVHKLAWQLVGVSHVCEIPNVAPQIPCVARELIDQLFTHCHKHFLPAVQYCVRPVKVPVVCFPLYIIACIWLISDWFLIFFPHV